MALAALAGGWGFSGTGVCAAQPAMAKSAVDRLTPRAAEELAHDAETYGDALDLALAGARSEGGVEPEELIAEVPPAVELAFDEPMQEYFRDLYDHVLHVFEEIEMDRDIVAAAFEDHLAVVSNRLNEVVLQPLAGIERADFVPSPVLADLEARSARFYEKAAVEAENVLGGLQRTFLKMAEENRELAARATP